ncbi:beta-ketoacyl synthase chain length factor [Rhodoferax saidenbachensis]|uniref:Beta-ketoacyl synthase-like N-terminal domain-containing protein n=2 Tax=Rhodoferax saidenbachensis TaxID=1484693 RepID=A0A1P8KAS1_9BURK|nr:beta-ketoacyl synthase chain length factor [Rhodoferax saidenbachensis]APW43109.1 hypothetical protein RS694_11610 [Rhodoferax saidenbachensis]
MLEFEFTVLDWSAYAAGLGNQQDWLDWAARPPQLPTIDAQAAPALTEMPAMMRRRLSPLGRYACQVAWWCQQQPDSAPLVFASRYGDAAHTLTLLKELVQGQSLSPTAFSLSVHNAFSAVYGIARGHTGNALAVSAGRASVGAALVEAAALLADGAPDVLIVFYEAPLPQHYRVFHDEALAEYAWCWRISKPVASRPLVRVRVDVPSDPIDHSADATPAAWPSGLAVLRHVLQQMAQPEVQAGGHTDASLQRQDRPGSQWTWSAHA